MGRIFTETDIRIFTKLAPETGGNIQSGSGHAFPFILRPVSHRFAQDADDFKNRISRLDNEEIEYLVGLILADQEELLTLDEEDFENFLDLVAERLSPEKKKEIADHLGVIV
ncbi:MAG: hypothetical protein II940_03775 [Methanosarcinaceae archaeon]|nr:hypothetical protein [Methanosarcinaceae archaeon]